MSQQLDWRRLVLGLILGAIASIIFVLLPLGMLRWAY